MQKDTKDNKNCIDLMKLRVADTPFIPRAVCAPDFPFMCLGCFCTAVC
jgi:hypothetical protein